MVRLHLLALKSKCYFLSYLIFPDDFSAYSILLIFSLCRCPNCCQPCGEPSNCLCLKEQIDALKVDPMQVNNVAEADDVFPDSAYHLLARLLDLDADTRITAAQALEHPFVLG